MCVEFAKRLARPTVLLCCAVLELSLHQKLPAKAALFVDDRALGLSGTIISGKLESQQ